MKNRTAFDWCLSHPLNRGRISQLLAHAFPPCAWWNFTLAATEISPSIFSASLPLSLHSLSLRESTNTNKNLCTRTHPHVVDVHTHWRYRACMQACSHTRACFLHFIHSERPFPHPCCHLHTHTSLNYSFCSLDRFDMLCSMRLKSSWNGHGQEVYIILHKPPRLWLYLNQRLEQQTGSE